MRPKVLIVEDNSDFREALHYFFELKGFKVIIAGNGKEAVEVAEKTIPDIILMDLNLPKLDGLEATSAIKKSPGMAQIPIVVISAYCRDYETRQVVIRAGALKCLEKPVDMEKLFDLISGYV